MNRETVNTVKRKIARYAEQPVVEDPWLQDKARLLVLSEERDVVYRMIRDLQNEIHNMGTLMAFEVIMKLVCFMDRETK